MMRHLTALLAAMLLLSSQSAYGASNYSTYVLPTVGYQVDIPSYWQNWLGDDNPDDHTNLFVGITGKKFVGALIMMGPAGAGPGLDFDNLGPLQMLTGPNPELIGPNDEPGSDEFEGPIPSHAEISGYPAICMRGRLANPDNGRYFELEVYVGESGTKSFTLVLLASPGHYDDMQDDLEHVRDSFTLL